MEWGTEDEVERCDQKKGSFVKIQCPEIVRRYNQGMGCVDKLDQLISPYRTEVRSRKRTLRKITHAFDLAVENSWFEYQREKSLQGVPQQHTLDPLHFKMDVTEVLVRAGKPQAARKKREVQA